MTELADEEISFKKPVEREEISKKFRDFGWWTDNRGYKHYGPIPLTEQEKNINGRINPQDSWLY
jgi:hypothetical protein